MGAASTAVRCDESPEPSGGSAVGESVQLDGSSRTGQIEGRIRWRSGTVTSLSYLVKPTSYRLSSFASAFESSVKRRSSTIARLSFARS